MSAIILLASGDIAGQTVPHASFDAMARGLTVTARALVVGAYPGDEDARLIALLSRGYGVETGVLSLTRGEAGLNYLGGASGESLGAVRSEEVLATRRMDGARQFFTRAYDFGFSRSLDAAFERWPRQELLSDMVAVMRAFRPQVVISVFDTTTTRFARSTRSGNDAVRKLTAALVMEAFTAAADTVQFSNEKYGSPWQAEVLYAGSWRGRMPADPEHLAMTSAVIARQAVAVQRTQIRPQSPAAALLVNGRGFEEFRVVARRTDDSAGSTPDIFAGVDTTFARLGVGAADQTAGALARTASLSQRIGRSMNPSEPWMIVPALSSMVAVLDTLRETVPRCRHPAIDALVAAPELVCDARTLDRDAAIDVMRRRAIDLLLRASGITFDVNASAELVAYDRTMQIRVAAGNRGREVLTILDARINKRVHDEPSQPMAVAPAEERRWTQQVTGLQNAHPWWTGTRLQDLYPPIETPIDGLARITQPGAVATLPAAAVPADYRRRTDLSVTLSLAGTTFATSLGALTYAAAGPVTGVQLRHISGVPPVTIALNQNLQWVQAAKPLNQMIAVTVTSHTDTARTFSLRVVAPDGLRVDSLPTSVTLQPGEARELLIWLRGRVAAGRHEFGIIGVHEDGIQFGEGFRTLEFPHINPIYLYRSSAMHIQSVPISVPNALVVAYVRGDGDGSAAYLRQLGVTVTEVGVAEFPLLDLSRYSTLVIGPQVFDANPQLVAYQQRMIDFMRRGGTLVLQQSELPARLRSLMPFEMVWNLQAERVMASNAPVNVLLPTHQSVLWPNRIADDDWSRWVGERASFMPTIIDQRYVTPIETHDAGERENRGAVVYGRVGAGRVVLTTLSLPRQLAAGVPGGARLLVNLLSAGLPMGQSR